MHLFTSPLQMCRHEKIRTTTWIYFYPLPRFKRQRLVMHASSPQWELLLEQVLVSNSLVFSGACLSLDAVSQVRNIYRVMIVLQHLGLQLQRVEHTHCFWLFFVGDICSGRANINRLHPMHPWSPVEPVWNRMSVQCAEGKTLLLPWSC